MVFPYERGAVVRNSNNYMTNIEVSYSKRSRLSADMKKTTRIKYLCGHGLLIRKYLSGEQYHCPSLITVDGFT